MLPSPVDREVRHMVRLREFYQDPNAPGAHDVLPAAFAAVRNSAGALLLVRRIDDDNWELPGGRIEVGESAGDTVVREVAEESGITIELTGLAGVYSDPTHVLLDPDGTVHQQLALCFHAVPAPAGETDRPRPDDIETNGAAWFDTSEIADLKVHPAMQLRIANALGVFQQPYFE
jgi:ADP-ribose pyrophosphatase YjhB (NUDIX family)